MLSRFKRLQKEADKLEASSDLRAAAFYTYWAWCSVLYPEETACLIAQEDLWPFIYTPNIAPAMRYENLLERYLPKEFLPLVIEVNQQFIKRMEENEEEIVGSMMSLIKKAIKKRYESLRSPCGPGWSGERLKRVVICDSDGGRPLGEGDLGRNACLITVGKLMCTSAVSEGVIHPAETLGILIDVGTNRKRLLEDDQYQGLKVGRMSAGDSEYQGAMKVIKEACRRLEIGFVQDEDFMGPEAWFNISLARERLERYLNDDIEGTGNLMAEILLLAQSLGINLKHSVVICHGAGGAGSGIKDQAKKVFGGELPEEVFEQLFWFLDTAGLLVEDRQVKQKRGQKEFKSFQEDLRLMIRENDPRMTDIQAFRSKFKRGIDQPIALVEVVKIAGQRLKKLGDGALFLYGFSMSPGGFSDELIATLAEMGILAFMVAGSNPLEVCEILTENDLKLLSEAQTKEEKIETIKKRVEHLYRIYQKQGGRSENLRLALGSAYISFEKPDRRQGKVAQGNNLFTFGAIIYAVIEGGFSRLTSKMMAAAARAGVKFMLEQERENFDRGALYPGRSNLLAVIMAKTAAMIWAGLTDREVEVNNPRWVFLREQIKGLSGEEGIGAVRKELEKVRKENRQRNEKAMALRRKMVAETEVAKQAFRASLAVLRDVSLTRAAEMITAKTP